MQLIRRGLQQLVVYKWLAIGALISMLIVTATNLITPQLFQNLIDDGLNARNSDVIVSITVILVIIAIVRGLFNFTNAYWSEKASQGIAYDLRNDLFVKLENLSFSFHDSHNVGQLMTRATSDVEGVRQFYAQGVLQLISAIVTFIGTIIILLTTEWTLALAVLVVIVLIVVVFAQIFQRLGPMFGQVQQNLGILNNILQENIEGIRVVKGFTAESRELQRYNDQNKVLYDMNLQVVNVFSIGFPTVFLLSNVATLIVIWLGGERVISETMTLGTLVAFNSYLTYLVTPIFQIGFIAQQLSRAQASGKRIYEILDTEIEIDSKPNAIELHNDVAGEVVFENVSFTYPGNDDNVLKNISLRAGAGTTVALLGPTGSGKSSLVNLIPRFYDVTDGSVKIDGVDVRNLELLSLRHEIGVVLQNVNLVSGTIRENICFGKADATDAEVEEACRIAQAHDFIMKLDDGYNTHVGEGGSGLSGGQKQRIAIARALVVHPRILIFDDSMSAVDAETEAKLRLALKPYLENHTAFIIAQRISTVRNADQILVIDKGEIVAQGTHHTLMETSQIYVDIVNSQLEDDEIHANTI